MSVSINRRAHACRAIALAWCVLNSAWLAAQDRANEAAPLVVVGDGRDAVFVRQIGGAAITVVAPFMADDEYLAAEYDRCNCRAQALRQFSVYLARADASCPRECFWRDRLTRENPLGVVRWIASRGRAPEHRCQSAARETIEVHRVLVAALPEHRQTFDANLAAELERLSRLRLESNPLVSVDRQP